MNKLKQFTLEMLEQWDYYIPSENDFLIDLLERCIDDCEESIACGEINPPINDIDYVKQILEGLKKGEE